MAILSGNRRSFLKATGVSLALPLFESLRIPAWAKNSSEPPIRMVCIGNEFGMYPGAFWPKQSGPDYEFTELLKPLQPHRNDFTLFQHLDHGVKGGHFAVHSFLTGVKSSEASTVADGGISLDQRAAEFIGSRTRFPSLTIGSETGLHGGCQMSWTRTGTRVPPIPGPRELFRELFVDDTQEARRKAADRLRLHGSILDTVLDDAHALKKRLNQDDSRKLDEYFHSIRDVERRLDLDRQWQRVSKPTPTINEPDNQGLTRDLPTLYDLILLAIQTDSTRVATLEIAGGFLASELGIRKGYHALSHHGQLPENIEKLIQIEMYQMEHFSRFLTKLKSIREPQSDGTLLNRTIVLMGSGMGNANSHTNHDLPIILAGGGFQHGKLQVYPKESNKRVPLCNLYLSMLQRFGLEIDDFSTSTGTLSGLQLA